MLVLLLVPASLLPAQAQTPQLPSVASTSQVQWLRALVRTPKPTAGCFKVKYPETAWKQEPCVKPPNKPFPPRRGLRGQNVGNGVDYAATSNNSTTAAEGSFPSISGVTSEQTVQPGQGSGTANDWTLQLNTQFFQTSACSGSPNPGGCSGWEQFIVLNNSSSSSVFIQYWMIAYNKTCPAGWNTFPVGSSTDCWRNSSNGTAFPGVAITQLAQMVLTGTAGAGATHDSATLALNGTSYSMTGDNPFPDLGQRWQTSEFNIVGDCCGSSAVFNSGASVQVQTAIDNGTNAAPTCQMTGFTGETNNLNLVGTPTSAVKEQWPSITFNQNNLANQTPASCATAISWGDTHIVTFAKAKFDFQPAGHFLLFNDASGFEVYSNQVSGAPTWPNASMNSAASIQMEDVAVVVPASGNALTVEGKPRAIPNGTSGPYGKAQVQIRRNNTEYLISDANGNQVQVDQRAANPNYVDVQVTPGKSISAKATGVLVGPPKKVSFATLYDLHAKAWHAPTQGPVLHGARRVELALPAKAFHADDLSAAHRTHGQEVCKAAGVTDPTLLEACVMDVAVIGNDRAADVYKHLPVPKSTLGP